MATLADRLQQYEDLYNKAAGYNANQFQTDFEKAYNEATNNNKDLINQQSNALAQLQSVGPTLRAKYSSLVTDPTQQLALISQARNIPLTDYSNAVNLLSARGNKYSDILGKAVNAYTQEQTSAQNAADNAWKLYQDAVSQDQFNRNLAASTKSSGVDLSSLLSLMGYGNTTATTSNPQTIIKQIIADTKANRKNMTSEEFNQAYQEINNQAANLGLKLNPEQLWVELGNTPSKPITYNLFM